MFMIIIDIVFFFVSNRRRHTRCALVTGVQTCALPISSNSMPNFSDFRRLVLTPGKAEIDQLAAFTMDWVVRRGARGKITHVTITFYPKDDDATNAAADEAERHSTGRRSRREGKNGRA